MTTYTKMGNIFTVTDDESMQTFHKLPPGNYVVKFNGMTGQFYLEHIDNFTMPPKLYGSIGAQAERIMNTYHSRGASTGVLLNGLKGSGKTLLAKKLSMLMGEADCPTLLGAPAEEVR